MIEPWGMTMKLYRCPLTCSEAVELALVEGGVAYEPVDATIFTPESTLVADGSPLARIHPKGYVPILELDDGQRLTEVPAILSYIADISQSSTLFKPTDAFSRARQIEWLAFTSSELHKGVSMLGGSRLLPEAKDRMSKRYARLINHVDQHLSTRQYLVQNQFGVADCFMVLILDVWIPLTRIVDLSPHKNIERYVGEINKRSNVQKVIGRAREAARAMQKSMAGAGRAL